jgi:hypothetical protein
MEVHIKITGSLLIVLSLMHIFIPKFFKWEQELSSLSLITRQILYVHTFFIAFMVLLMGLLCVGYSHELIYTPLGKIICIGLFGFWFMRLSFQFFVYSAAVWKGKRFETIMHILFSILWTYITAVFLFASIFNVSTDYGN